MVLRRICLVVTSSICLAMLLACTGQLPQTSPRSQQPQQQSDVQRGVAETPPASVKDLTAKELNEFVVEKKKKDGRLPYGSVYDVQGTIKSITIQENLDTKLERYSIVVVVKDYAAVVVVCQFASEHKQTLASLKSGETVKVRGKLSVSDEPFRLSPSSDMTLILNGCIIQR